MKPKKPPTVSDLALKQVFQDLIDRGQIPVLEDFAKSLGFAQSAQLRGFLKGRLNFPKKRLDDAVKALKDTYNVSDSYIRTGHGSMYKNNRPYLVHEHLPVIQEHENVFSIGKVKRIRELEEENQRLKEQLATNKPAAYPTTMSEFFVSRSMAVQEVVLELLAGLVGTSFEEVFAKVRSKEIELQQVASAGGNAYSNRIRHISGGSSS